MGENNLPFQVGQTIESRSFIKGYRSAWFRCKIKDIGQRKGQMAHALEYIDFPDEKITWMNLYQKPPADCRKPKKIKRELMVRPCFPTIHRKGELHDVNTISEVVVIDGAWNLGDLVDWWTDGCFWSAKITKLLQNDKVEIELPQPPVGEGLSYEVSGVDLRPSLIWSPKYGWMLPTSKEGDKSCQCARITKPPSQAGAPSLALHSVRQGRWEIQEDGKEMHKSRMNGSSNGIGKNIALDAISGPRVKCTSTELGGGTVWKNEFDGGRSSKKMRTDGNNSQSLICSDTLEAAVLDLEELINFIKQMKGCLELGNPLSNKRQPTWKFLEHHLSSKPK